MIGYPLQYSWASLVVQVGCTCNAGDLGSIPGSGRFPRGGHGNPFQYSCLENPHGQRSLVGYSPGGLQRAGLGTAQHVQQSLFFLILIWPLQLSCHKYNDFSFNMCHISGSLTKSGLVYKEHIPGFCFPFNLTVYVLLCVFR